MKRNKICKQRKILMITIRKKIKIIIVTMIHNKSLYQVNKNIQLYLLITMELKIQTFQKNIEV